MEGYIEETNKGYSLIEQGRANQAILLFRQIAQRAEKEKDDRIFCQALLAAAEAAETAVIDELSSYYRDAQAYLRVVSEFAKNIDRSAYRGEVLMLKGILSLDIGGYGNARDELGQAIIEFSKIGAAANLAISYSNMGYAILMSGDPDTAKNYLERADQFLWEIPHLGLINVKAKIIRALVCLKTDQIEQAERLLDEQKAWLSADHEGEKFYRLELIVETIERSYFKATGDRPSYLKQIDPYVARAIELRYS